MINNDDYIARGREMEERAQRHWLKDFIGQSFKFFSEDRLGIPADVILKFDRITKLSPEKTILVGTVTYNTTQIEGDGIMIDFVHNKVQYHERGSRYAFNLEVDKRSEPLWNQLISQIKMALEARVK